MGRLLRYSGVAAVVTVWTTLLTATVVSDFDLLGTEPLSDLGSSGEPAALFTFGLAVPALLFAAFHHHLRRRFRVSRGFSVAMLVGLAGQMVAAFVPIGGDPAAHRLHTAAALTLGASLPLLMWQFAASQPPGRWRQRGYRLFWIEVAACAGGFALSSWGVAALAEALPAAAFHAWVLVTTLARQPAGLPRRSAPTGPRRLAPAPA